MDGYTVHKGKDKFINNIVAYSSNAKNTQEFDLVKQHGYKQTADQTCESSTRLDNRESRRINIIQLEVQLERVDFCQCQNQI